MAVGSTRQQKKRKPERYFDYSFLFIILFLLGFGLVMIYSSSSYDAFKDHDGDSAYYLKKQFVATLLGLVLMAVAAIIPYQIWKRFTVLAYIGSIMLLFLVRVPGLGYTANGATRWIRIFGITFQPAEVAKLGIIICLANLISRMGRGIQTVKGFLFIFLLPFPMFLAIWQVTENLSSAIIVYGIGFIMLFVASPQYKVFMGIVATGSVLAVGLVFIITKIASQSDNFRFDRVMAWLNPEAYPKDEGFQVLQSLYAIGSGGILGKGLGRSIQKLGFLPESQNDMIFSIICEELGLFGGISIILMFVLLLWRCMVIANNAPDLFGALLVVGVMGHIAIQVILNIAVVTNTMPNTGISLPFISYGGTSVLFLLIEMGIVMSVSLRIKLKDL